jgi:hypothetical protein
MLKINTFGKSGINLIKLKPMPLRPLKKKSIRIIG